MEAGGTQLSPKDCGWEELSPRDSELINIFDPLLEELRERIVGLEELLDRYDNSLSDVVSGQDCWAHYGECMGPGIKSTIAHARGRLVSLRKARTEHDLRFRPGRRRSTPS